MTNVVQVAGAGEVQAVDVDASVTVTGVEIPAWSSAQRLDDLTDVDDAALGLSGQVLVKGIDGIWRPGSVSGGGSDQLVVAQGTPAATWSITHNLGRYPQVTVIDTNGERVLPDLDYVSLNAVTITHAAPVAGTAILT